MRYFNKCKSIEDVKETFRKLAKQLHPDNGGNAEEFKAMKAEYESAFNRLKNVHRTQEGKTYESKQESTETPEMFAAIIEKLLKMDGVKIEIIGSWIWLTGNTMAYKEEIKALHFFWSSTKKAWYYTGEEKKSRRKGHYSMDGLRNKWGSQTVGTGKEEKNNRLTA